MDFYNDIERTAAAWLRELIREQHLPNGVVDERSIADIKGEELHGYRQCHFFAGIGGWPLALQLAGWPATRPVWTCSCPCQPFSSAGKRKTINDERHLWPEAMRLIRELRPATIFGEQVASSEVVGSELEAAFIVAVQGGNFAKANKLAKRLVAGKDFHFHPRWVDGIRSDLEAEGYAFRWKVLGAHSVGAPQPRQRLYWVANAEVARGRPNCRAIRSGTPARLRSSEGEDERRSRQCTGRAGDCGSTSIVANAGQQPSRDADAGSGIETNQQSLERRAEAVCEPGRRGEPCRMADANGRQPGDGGLQRGGEHGQQPKDGGFGAWDDYDIIPCRDGRSRRVESGTFPLAHGIPGRVGLLRGYGNAIVPQVAATFIRAFLEVESE